MAKILVIDDDEDLLQMLGESLTTAGHHVVTVTDGYKGTKLFKCVKFDVIVTDIVMPNQEGLETIGKVRRHYPDMGIIAMCGSLQSEGFLESAGRLGADHVLPKPFTARALHEAVDAVTNRAV